MNSKATYIIRTINAPRAKVYQLLLTSELLSKWKVPDNMQLHVHTFEAHEGGTIRLSLSYHDTNTAGKTSGYTDTYHGYFKELIPDEKIVEVDEFETTDPDMKGEMTITYLLKDKDGGTELTAFHKGLPKGVSLKDNELGWTMALDKLTRLLEKNQNHE